MPSNRAKQKWNAEQYTQVKVSVNPDTAAAFKAACAEAGRSQASVLSEFMTAFCLQTPHKPPHKHSGPSGSPVGTRKKRRAVIKAITSQLEELLAEEERYRDSVPENLQGGKWHEASESAITALSDIIELLPDIYE